LQVHGCICVAARVASSSIPSRWRHCWYRVLPWRVSPSLRCRVGAVTRGLTDASASLGAHALRSLGRRSRSSDVPQEAVNLARDIYKGWLSQALQGAGAVAIIAESDSIDHRTDRFCTVSAVCMGDLRPSADGRALVASRPVPRKIVLRSIDVCRGSVLRLCGPSELVAPPLPGRRAA
jgi:hypothetical protein